MQNNIKIDLAGVGWRARTGSGQAKVAVMDLGVPKNARNFLSI